MVARVVVITTDTTRVVVGVVAAVVGGVISSIAVGNAARRGWGNEGVGGVTPLVGVKGGWGEQTTHPHRRHVVTV